MTGVRALVVITAGFAEVGEEGRRLQAQLLRRYGGMVCGWSGPNCFGILNTDPAVRLNATFTSISLAGSIAMSSQSGALGWPCSPLLGDCTSGFRPSSASQQS